MLLGLFFLMAGLVGILGNTALTSARLVAGALGNGNCLLGGMLALSLGLLALVVGAHRLSKNFFQVLLPTQQSPWRVYFQRQYLAKGPRIVALGGGTGLSVLLRGLKAYSRNITAIVTVADDGGSSGRLRQELRIPPPGDIRNCLIALADTESLMEDLFNYRFHQGEGLAGHSLGNLLLAAMTDMAGDFELAIQEMSRVLAVGGRVLPSTRANVVLAAEMEDGTVVWGQSQIPKAGKKIKRVFLDPPHCQPTEAVLKAIEQAEIIIIGPGSLYTSLLPNLVIPGMAEALRRSPAPKIYVCNIMTQPGETDGFSVGDHLQALMDHCGEGIVQIAVAHEGSISLPTKKRYEEAGAHPVKIDRHRVEQMGVELYTRYLVDENYVLRHNPQRLAKLIMEELGHRLLRRCSLWGE